MKTPKTIRLSALLAAAPLFVGCAAQSPNPEIESLEARYNALSNRTAIVAAAPDEMTAANQALAASRRAYREDEAAILEHQLFVGNKNLDIAEIRLTLTETREQIDSAKDRRRKLQLDASRAEADTARMTAERAMIAARESQAALSRKEEALAERERALAKAQREAAAAQAEAEAMADELEALNMKMSNRGMVLTLSDIVFDFGKAELKPGSERIVERLSEFLKDHDQRQVVIEGYTDAVGSESFNERLAMDRAEAVASALTRTGIDQSRLTTRSLGEDYPVASNDTAAGRQQNRRVEIVIGDEDGTAIEPRLSAGR